MSGEFFRILIQFKESKCEKNCMLSDNESYQGPCQNAASRQSPMDVGSPRRGILFLIGVIVVVVVSYTKKRNQARPDT